MADEEDLGAIIDEGRDSMGKALERFGKELTKIRTGRASTSILDGITVDYFDTPTPLNQLATLSVPDPRMIVVSPFDKSAIAAIEKMIHASNLGLTPNNDGKVIRIQIPPLTEERRVELGKVVHHEGENTKIAIRNIRRDAMHHIKELLKEKDISEDQEHKAEHEIQNVTDRAVGKADGIVAEKEKELLEI